MKINQNFAKKAMLVASLTAGVVGFNSMFNEAQATGQTMTICPGSGEKCNATITYNGTTTTIQSEKNPGSGSVVVK